MKIINIFSFRFTTPHHKEGFELFLDTIISMEDVWIVSTWQMLQWMRDPVPLENIMDYKPFQCEYKVVFYLNVKSVYCLVCYYPLRKLGYPF